MNVFFDVDHTIQDGDGRLRPRVREVFEKLTDDGHQLFIWSGMGLRWAEVHKHRLAPYVRGVFTKPMYNYRAAMVRLGITVEPDFVVDDYPEVVQAFGGMVVTPYLVEHDRDAEMDRVYEVIVAVARDGHAADPSFVPRSCA